MSERWVDVSHEALIRGWPRLRRWIEENRAGLRVHRRLTEAALEWDKTGRDNSALYRGARLSQAVEWRQGKEASLNELERAFLDASAALERHEIESRERLRQRVIGGLSAALAIFVILTVLAFLLWRQSNLRGQIAHQRGEIALARQLAAQADLLRDQPKMLSRRLVLATEAMQRLQAVDAHSLEVDVTLRRELALSDRHVARFPVKVQGEVRDVQLSPDGRYVIGGNYFEGTASVWEIATRKKLVHIEIDVRELTATRLGQEPIRMQTEGPGGSSQIKALSPEGKVLVTVNGDGHVDAVQVWEVATGRELLPLKLSGRNHYVLSDDGRYLAVSTSIYDDDTRTYSEAITRVWDIEARREIPGSAPGYVRDFSQDGRYVTTSLHLWDVSTGAVVSRTDMLIRRAPVVTPSGQHLSATASVDGKAVDVWEIRPAGGAVIAVNHAVHVVAVGLTPQGRLTTIVHNGENMTAHTWGLETGQEKPDLAIDLDGYDATFAPDGLSFVVMDTSGVEVRRAGHSQPVAKLAFAGSERVAWSPDGRYLAAAPESKREARVWDLSSRQSVGQLALPGPPTALALTRGGDSLAAVVGSGKATRSGEVHTAKLWKVASGQELSSFEPDKGQSIRSDTHCALNAQYLVTRDLEVWEMKSGAAAFRLGLNESVTNCVLSADGRYLATSSGEEMVRIWDLKNVKQAFQIPTKDRPLAFDQDSRYLATISEDKTVQVWFLRQDDLIAEACRRLPRNLTEQEWGEYLGDEAYRKTCPKLP